MVEYAEKRLPEFRSAYDKLTHCAKEMTLLYEEDIFATVVRDPKRVVFFYIYMHILFCLLTAQTK